MILLFRSFAKPPQAVQDISECIVVMRGYKDISWKTAKGMMAEGNFLKTLQVGGGKWLQKKLLCIVLQRFRKRNVSFLALPIRFEIQVSRFNPELAESRIRLYGRWIALSLK